MFNNIKFTIGLVIVLFLSGCGQSPQEMKAAIDECTALGMGYWDSGVFWNEVECSLTGHSALERPKEEKCSDTCKDLFSGLENAWGDEADSDEVSKSLLQCFNDCLSRE